MKKPGRLVETSPENIGEVVAQYLPYLFDTMDTLVENEGWQGAHRHSFKLKSVLFDVARACFKLGQAYEKERTLRLHGKRGDIGRKV